MIARRAPSVVMRLKRLGSLHQCRLSFMRVLTRRLAADSWRFDRPQFDIDANGVGHAVYTAAGPERTYSLVCFAHDLPAEKRSDRVIAEAWDTTFALVDGVATRDDIDRLRANVPLQEAGRVSARELTMSRANRSVRLWDHVVEALANGRQPDAHRLAEIGYLMRTTAVYGSGKFGAADWETIADRAEMQSPFQAEMLTVFLIRSFVRDLVEHIALEKGGDQAVRLDPDLARSLGIGNSTGLGMAPFLVNHPVLFNNWIMAREEALAAVRGVRQATADEVEAFRGVLGRTDALVDTWTSAHVFQQVKLRSLRGDLDRLRRRVDGFDFAQDHPWDRLFRWADASLTEEGQELLVSLMMEPYGHLVDDLVGLMSDRDSHQSRINGAMPVGDVRALIAACFGWAVGMDWTVWACSARAWYVSAEKQEPRMGERFEEPIEPFEQPLAPARDAVRAYDAMAAFSDATPVAEFLLKHPEHRHTVRRAQLAQDAPYAEICDNTIAADMLPIDMLRAKLSFFGATRFDPRSDRWVRICMFAGAPYPEDLETVCADLWVYPA